LWPRLHSAYLEKQPRDKECQQRAKERSRPAAEGPPTADDPQENEPDPAEKFRWSAAIAAGTWSDLLLEYWRGCPPILWLLLTCPAFLTSHDRFQSFPKNRYKKHPKTQKAWFERLSKRVFDDLVKKDLTSGITAAVVGEAFCIERAPVKLFNPQAAHRVELSGEVTVLKPAPEEHVPRDPDGGEAGA
jgi:hypothetical protein